MRQMRKYRDFLVERLTDCEEAIAYFQTSIEEYQNDGDNAAFLIALQSIAKAQPANKELMYKIRSLSGLIYYLQEEYDRALEEYNTAIELNPHAEAYYIRGLVYHHKGDYDNFIDDFNKAIQLKPNNAYPYYSRGVVYMLNGDYVRAISDFNRAISLNPDFPEAYFNRGAVYRDRGEYNHSIADYTRAIQLKPNDAEAYNNRANVYDKKDEYDLAITDFNKALQLNPNYADAYYNRGLTNRNRGEYDLAIEDYNKAIQLKPNDADAYHNRGAVQDDKREYDLAIGDYNKAIQLKPNDADAYFCRGLVYGRKGEVDRAIADFDKAIQLKSNYADAYYNRGVAYDVKGEVDRAVEDYNKAIQLNPNYADAYRNRGEEWLNLGVRKITRSYRTTVTDMEINAISPFHNAFENLRTVKSDRSTSSMSNEKIEGIAKIAVSGFKSLANECTIDICPLTILAGANSSGKSSIMQPLLMLKQTLEAPYDPGPLLIDGPNAQFTSAAQFLSKLIGEKGAEYFQLRIETDESISVRTTFRKGASGIELSEMIRDRRLETDQPLEVSFKSITLYPEMSAEKIKMLAEEDSMPKDLREDLDVVGRSRCFLHLESQDRHKVVDFTHDLAFNIVNSIHLPGLRGNPERLYKLTSTGSKYPGTFENYVASIIHSWQETTDERLNTLADALHALGLTGHVGTKKIGDTRIELQVGRLPHPGTGETDMVSIADVGFGVSQILPVLVALIVAEPGRLVYLEQPEMHLHPHAQVALAQVLATAAKRGVRIVAETHSSRLLLAVQTLVAEGDLSPELVKLHWFTRGENGATEINTADLDEAGAYGDWPEDFDDVDLKAQSRYLNAAQLRLAERA